MQRRSMLRKRPILSRGTCESQNPSTTVSYAYASPGTPIVAPATLPPFVIFRRAGVVVRLLTGKERIVEHHVGLRLAVALPREKAPPEPELERRVTCVALSRGAAIAEGGT